MEAHFIKYLSFIPLLMMISISALADPDSYSSDTLGAEQSEITVSEFEENKILENLRWALDVSTRQIRNLEADEWYAQDVYGFDLHKVFSGSNGDYGTLVFQPYLVHLKNIPNPPFFFDDGDDWELTWRIANFNYTGLAHGKFNIRIGHFEVPFGLEQNTDTNGTLRQYTFKKRGIKADWGTSINGSLPKFDYEFAFTRGSSNEFLDRDNPYVLSGRVGTPSHQNTIFGFSYFYGEVLAGDQAVKRKHLGIDIAHYIYQWELLSEFSGGENDDNEVFNWLGELSWRNLAESIQLYLQTNTSYEKLKGSWDEALGLTFGATWKFNRQLSLSSQLFHEVDNPTGMKADTTASFQLRVRI